MPPEKKNGKINSYPRLKYLKRLQYDFGPSRRTLECRTPQGDGPDLFALAIPLSDESEDRQFVYKNKVT